MVPAVSFQGITKRFGPLLANDGVTFDVEAGTVHALLGENGAGKTTLLSILFGLQRPDRGHVSIDGVELPLGSPAASLAHGIGLCAQHFLLAGALTGFENILLGRPGCRGVRPLPRERREALRRRAEEHGLAVALDRPVSDLSIAAQERIEILKLLTRESRILVLDEPTAVLAPPEVAPLFATLRRLASEGRTVLLVTHRLGEVAGVADRVTVLRRGRVVGEGKVPATSREMLVDWITGAEARPARALSPREPGETLLRARALACGSGPSAPEGCDLDVRAGEIVGLGGVHGNGQSEIVQALTGQIPLRAGEVEILGRRVKAPESVGLPQDLAWIPEDRRQEGLALEMSCEENLAIGLPRGAAPRGEAARSRLEEFGVRPADPRRPARHLSGGNQQRLLLARELSRSARLLLAIHPTRGLDPQATRDVRDRLLDARGRGVGILLVTGDFEELRELSDRVLILFRGRVLYDAPSAAIEEGTMHRALVGIQG